MFLATDRLMSREVAIKILSPTDGEYAGTVSARFLREAQVFATLEDPHTITMYDFGATADGLLYMVFEYIRGEDLVAAIRDGRARHPRVVAHVLGQLLSALREAHDRGIFHRDLKPGNVLIYAYGDDPFRVKLIDFGIAKDSSANAASITRTGRIVGTLRYMAPEQLFGQPLGPESDLYSLGLLAFEMLTGTSAISGISNEEILRQQVSDEPIRVPIESAPPPLRRLIERLAAKDRTARFQTAADALAEVRRVQRTLLGTEDQTPLPPTASADAPRVAPTASVSGERAPLAPAGTASHVQALAIVSLIALAVVGAYLTLRRPEQPKPVKTRADVAKLLAPAQEPATVPPPATASAGGSDAGAIVAQDASGDASVTADGCGEKPNWRGEGRMIGRYSNRSWIAHIPENYDPAVRYPLLLMFHRSWSKASDMLTETKMGAAAAERGFIVFAFEGEYGFPWQDLDAIEYVFRAVEHAHAQLCIDKQRLFAVGEGMGGDFVQQLSCAMPLSAIALTGHAEHESTTPCVPDKPPARIRFYGTADQHVPFKGGNSCVLTLGSFKSAVEIDEQWKSTYECGGSGKTWLDAPGGKCKTWKCDVAPMVTCETHHGHYWGGVKPDIPFPGCNNDEHLPAFPFRDTLLDFLFNEGRVLEQ